MVKLGNRTKIYQKLLGSFLIVFLAGCGGKQADAPFHNREWKTSRIDKSEITLYTDYSASIQGKQDIEIRPQVAGVVESVLINEGERVRRGQTLFIIDQVPYLAALRQAEASVKAAEATLASAKLNVDSKQRLFDQKVIAEYELLTAQNDWMKAEADLMQAQANELNARNNLSYTEVKSPADGVAGVIPHRVGALVNSNISQPLTTVSNNSEVDVYFSMSESQILLYLRQYGSMDSTLHNMGDLELILSDGLAYTEKGAVESVSGVVDRNTGSVLLRSRFPNAQRILLSGSTGNVRIAHQHDDVILIPQTATITIQDKFLVYKVENGKAKSTPIVIAPENNGQQFIVLQGLQVGDVIVADGAGLVREGMEITGEGV